MSNQVTMPLAGASNPIFLRWVSLTGLY